MAFVIADAISFCLEWKIFIFLSIIHTLFKLTDYTNPCKKKNDQGGFRYDGS